MVPRPPFFFLFLFLIYFSPGNWQGARKRRRQGRRQLYDKEEEERSARGGWAGQAGLGRLVVVVVCWSTLLCDEGKTECRVGL